MFAMKFCGTRISEIGESEPRREVLMYAIQRSCVPRPFNRMSMLIKSTIVLTLPSSKLCDRGLRTDSFAVYLGWSELCSEEHGLAEIVDRVSRAC